MAQMKTLAYAANSAVSAGFTGKSHQCLQHTQKFLSLNPSISTFVGIYTTNNGLTFHRVNSLIKPYQIAAIEALQLSVARRVSVESHTGRFN